MRPWTALIGPVSRGRACPRRTGILAPRTVRVFDVVQPVVEVVPGRDAQRVVLVVVVPPESVETIEVELGLPRFRGRLVVGVDGV